MKNIKSLFKNEVSKKVLLFFNENQNCIDTAKGISLWIGGDIDIIQKALNQLVKDGVITSQQDISKEFARIALGDKESTDKNISITDIIKVVTTYFDVRPADLQSKKRSQSITMPRQICMYLARSLTSHSLEEIGGHLGGRDHTTVMHACGKIAGLEQSSEKIKAQLADLTKRITK